jgi:hypothetical protein
MAAQASMDRFLEWREAAEADLKSRQAIDFEDTGLDEVDIRRYASPLR